MNQDLLEHIQNTSHRFSKGQRLIAQYIMEHYDNPATQAEYIYSLLKSEVI